MRILLPILCGLSILGAFGCYRDGGAKTSDNQEVKTDQPPNNGVAMSKESLSASADIPIYPGADVPEGESKVTPSDLETRYEIDMVTSDSMEKVAAYYKGKLSHSSVSSSDVMGVTPKGELAQIKLSKKEGKTHIAAVSVVEKKK